MENKILVLIIIIFGLLVLGIFFELNKTAYIVYGVCWEAEELEENVIEKLKKDGCTIETNICEKTPEFCIKNTTTTRVCCPFRKCPDYAGILC